MRDNSVIASHIIDVFSNNFEEDFIFDSLEQKTLSYQDFFIYVLNCVDILNELDKYESCKAAIITKNSLELVILYFAALIKGIAIIPIDPLKGDLYITEILSEAQCDIAISDSTRQLSDIVSSAKIISFDSIKDNLYTKRESSSKDLDVFRSIDFDKLYVIAFTSGTTGRPKGVMHSFSSFFMSALSFGGCFNFNNKNIFYHNLPMTYMAGILNLIVLPFIFGSKIVIGERFGIYNINNFWQAPIKYSANTFWFTPTMISLLLKLDRGTEGVEYAERNKITGCVGTAPLSVRTQKSFEDRYSTVLYESYGLSETLFVTTNSPNCKVDGSTGIPLKGVRLSFDVDDEILIETPWMFLGYSNFDSDNCFKDGRFRSGDFGEVDGDNCLTITGRKKDLIIKGGINISPKKIEDFISAYNHFEESVIVGSEDENLGEKTVCFYVPGNALDIQEVKKTLNRAISQQLGVDYRIDEFIKCSSIPKNINGKIDRQKIKVQYINQNQ